jgi:hypothetical protein
VSEPSASDVLAAVGAAAALLRSGADRPWSVIEPELGQTLSEVVAHQTQACLWYAVDLSAAGGESPNLEVRASAAGSPHDQIDDLGTAGRLLAAAVTMAPSAARGYHPFGQADAAGFAAMGCDEVLIHTADVAAHLGLDFAPDADLAARVASRLFPWAPSDVDPWDALRWANGRMALPGRPRLTRWRWHCAPLTEWNGRPPTGQR